MQNTLKAAFFVLLLLVPASCSVAQAPSVVGDWQGTLSVQSIQLRVVFHVQHMEGGALKATMDSPDQGATGIGVDSVSFQGGTLRMILIRLRGLYVGTMEQGDSVMKGTWSQGGMPFPLDLRRTSTAIVISRPQEPHPPYPYRSEEVAFENNSAGISLAGTLTIPEGTESVPAAILISGSGPQDRDETVFNHKPFKVIADYLTRHGVAVLRFDDRGTARSTGNFQWATSLDFAADVEAAIHFLITKKGIDRTKVGLIGHSEGGLIAPMVASRSKDVAFIVLLAGPALTGKEIITLQDSLISLANGASPDKLQQIRSQNDRLFGLMRSEQDTAAMRRNMREFLLSMRSREDSAVPAQARELTAARMVEQLTSPWFRFFLDYDPLPALQMVRCPVLALNGEKDLQVPAKINLAWIQKALTKGGNTNFEVKEMPGLNHLFQHSASGSPSEYAKLEETFAPEALSLVNDWIHSVLHQK